MVALSFSKIFRFKTGLFLFIFCLSPIVIEAETPAQIPSVCQPPDRCSVCRQADPIVIPGSELEAATGCEPRLVGLYALREDKMEPIPFQIDSKDDKDKYILVNVSGKTQTKAFEFDANDELVFMAKDLGDRCLPNMYPPNWKRGIEIEVVDPIDNTRGWTYLFTFEQPPLRAERSYTRYQFPINGEDKVETDVFVMQFPPVELKQAHSCCGLWILPAAGGNGENFLDRLKTRVCFKFLFSFFEINATEESLGGELIAYKDGPVHVIRQEKLFANLGFGLKSPGFVSDQFFYERIIESPMDTTFPFKFSYVFSSVTIRIGFDYLPNINGAKFYNSLNQEGFVIDGKPAAEEINMNHGESDWNLLTGPLGALMRRNVKVGVSHKYFDTTEYLWDDETASDPPESSPGNFGHTYQLWDVTDMPRGRYQMNLYFFALPNFKWGDQYDYIKIHDHPLKAEISELKPVAGE